MIEPRWCLECDQIQAEAGSDTCFRCRRRRDAGEPPLREVRAEGARALRERLVWFRGAYNGEVPKWAPLRMPVRG